MADATNGNGQRFVDRAVDGTFAKYIRTYVSPALIAIIGWMGAQMITDLKETQRLQTTTLLAVQLAVTQTAVELNANKERDNYQARDIERLQDKLDEL